MNDLDARTFARMWDTSDAVARARYDAEIARGSPPYDSRPQLIEPRDRVARCANPQCGFPIIVHAHKGPERRYCDHACLQSARYWRNPEFRRAQVRARYYRLRGARLAATTGARAAS